MIQLRASMMTDVGVVREHNEDAAYIDPRERFFIVADGMGGHAAGEVASAMAVETVRQALEEAEPQIHDFVESPSDTGRKALVAIVEQAVRTAHSAVYERGARETDKQGMGTTLDVVVVAGPDAFIAHVGDSRTYLIRNGNVAQITTDHTVAEVLVIEGKLSPEEAQVSPLRTILVNAIGVAQDVGVEMAHVRLRSGDQLLLCSDGLHDYFPVEQEIADQAAGKPEDILQDMVEAAKERGGHDNITGVVVQILEVAETGDEAQPSLGDIAASDGVPQAISRDDTLPVQDSQPHTAARDGATGERRGPVEASEEVAGEIGGGDGDAPEAEGETGAADGGADDGGADDGEARAEPAGDGDGEEEDRAAPGNGRDGEPTPPVVPETAGPAEDDEYHEDPTLVGYDPDKAKPPAPRKEGADGEGEPSTDAGDGERRDSEANPD